MLLDDELLLQFRALVAHFSSNVPKFNYSKKSTYLLLGLRVFFEHTANAKLLYSSNCLKTAELRNLGTLAFMMKFKFESQLGLTEMK
jgi:hypothetical protein